MPTYDYRCPNGHDFERFVRKFSDAETELVCPVCGAVAQRRVSGGAGLVFKGSGFYLTDYGKNAHRKSGSEPQASGESKSDSGGGSSGSDAAKSDSGASGGASSGSSGTTKSETQGPAKSDTAKSTEEKPSGKSKGGSSGGSGDTK